MHSQRSLPSHPHETESAGTSHVPTVSPADMAERPPEDHLHRHAHAQSAGTPPAWLLHDLPDEAHQCINRRQQTPTLHKADWAEAPQGQGAQSIACIFHPRNPLRPRLCLPCCQVSWVDGSLRVIHQRGCPSAPQLLPVLLSVHVQNGFEATCMASVGPSTRAYLTSAAGDSSQKRQSREKTADCSSRTTQ